MEVTRPAALNLTPAFDGLKGAWRDFLQNLPYLFVGIVIMLSTILAMPFSRRASERLLAQRIRIPLVRDLIARAVAVIVFLVGLYLVLRVSGTTQLALTVLGGTGLFGLVLGIAFRDITENFLASVFLSMQRPFQIGDLVEIVGVMGFVDRLTVRTTIIVSLDGNYVQIPNATVYKNTIRNFTNNPKRRDEFTLFIAYDKSLDDVQSTVLKVLNEHAAVLKQPEPWVLVDRLSERSVEVRVYFWIDCVKNNWLTVRSSIIRLSLHALKEAGLLTLPGASQMVFPQGIAIHRLNGQRDGQLHPRRKNGSHDETAARRTKAEGRSTGPAAQIEAQRQEARTLEAGPDLLEPAESPEASRQPT
jgi:small conductance mechanosensitive channel